MCTVRRELLDLFLQVVCRRGQCQAEEGGFFPSELLRDELNFLVEGLNEILFIGC